MLCVRRRVVAPTENPAGLCTHTIPSVGGETLTLNAPDLDLTSKSRVRLPVYRRNYFDETVQLHARPIISCKKNQPLHFYFIHSFNRFLKDVIAQNILSDIIVCIY